MPGSFFLSSESDINKGVMGMRMRRAFPAALAAELSPQLPGARLFPGIAQYQAGQVGDAAESLKAGSAKTITRAGQTGANP